MKIGNLNDFIGGWFMGDFNPTIKKTTNFEIAIKKYKKGDFEKTHFHKIATEFTIIVCGKVIMNNIEYSEGDIILINPGESTDFKCLTDVVTTVIKTPSVKNDKFTLN